MPISEFRKIQIEQRELEKKLDEIAEKLAKQRRDRFKIGYCMHTPPEALRELGKRKVKKIIK